MERGFAAQEASWAKKRAIDMDLLGLNPEETADIKLGRDLNQPEYDESAADDIEIITCPEC